MFCFIFNNKYFQISVHYYYLLLPPPWMVLLPSRTVLIAFLTIVLNYFNYICHTTYLADSAAYLVVLETVGLETKDMWLITHTNTHTHTYRCVCVCVINQVGKGAILFTIWIRSTKVTKFGLGNSSHTGPISTKTLLCCTLLSARTSSPL